MSRPFAELLEGLRLRQQQALSPAAAVSLRPTANPTVPTAARAASAPSPATITKTTLAEWLPGDPWPTGPVPPEPPGTFSMNMHTHLTTDSNARKEVPICTGVFDYF